MMMSNNMSNQEQARIRFSRAYQQIHGMVEAQMGLNKAAYSQTWMANGGRSDNDEELWDYPLAAAQEIGEFLNSWGYSWWSKAPVDKANCLTELVDAWHFITSQALINEEGDIDRASSALLMGYARTVDEGVSNSHRDVIRHAKKLMSYLADYNDTPVTLTAMYAKFFELMTAAGFSLDHFTARYNAKLQLNLFRQLNGYNAKPRTYKKLWADGKEDNFYLAQWIDNLIDTRQPLPSAGDTMRWIAANYSKVIGAKAVVPSDIDEEDETE
jgi:dimeric dUTPase (all-alpha-NTP-PPase superfamily)